MAVRVKLDGFRALAFIESGSCRLVSRKAHVYKSFPGLCQSLGHLPYEAVLDGEIVCLDRNGCPQFDSLFYRPGEPNFYAFDVPYLDGRDLRGTPLVERKRILGESFRDRIRDCSTSAILRAAELICFGKSAPAFLEGVVAKWKHGCYVSGDETSWVKIKNPAYSQAVDRWERFQRKPPQDRVYAARKRSG